MADTPPSPDVRQRWAKEKQDFVAQQNAAGNAAVLRPPAVVLPHSVVITDIRIGFGRMVELIILLTLAAIPAGVALGLIFGVFWAIIHAVTSSGS